MFGRISCVLLLVLLLPAALLAQSDSENEEDGNVDVAVTLEKGEIAAYELLLSEILETEREPSSRDDRVIAGSIYIPAGGEFLLAITQIHSDLIETEDIGLRRNWHSFETSRPSGNCRNLAFDNSEETIIFLNCLGSISFAHSSDAQFISLHLIQISDRSPFAERESSAQPETNNDMTEIDTEKGEISLSLTSGQRAPFSLLYSELIETAKRPTSYSANNRQIGADVEFIREGEYLLFVRAVGDYEIDSDTYGTSHWMGNVSVSLPAIGCQNQNIKDTAHWVETHNLILNCPITGYLSASGDAKYALAVLLKVSE